MSLQLQALYVKDQEIPSPKVLEIQQIKVKNTCNKKPENNISI